LNVNDRQGSKTLTYEDALNYHGRFHRAGVALGWKFLEGSMEALGISELPRFRTTLIAGATPPGVIDCLEFVTRAFSRQRAVVDPGFGDGPCMCSGRLSFAIKTVAGSVSASLRDNVIPADFAETARRIDAGICPADEEEAWRQRSSALADQFMATAAEELFRFEKSDDANSEKGQPEPFAFTPDTGALNPLRIADGFGDFEIPFDAMMRFHDKDHFAGIVLAHKLFAYVLDTSWAGQTIQRNDVHIRCGLNPPGLMDCFEYVVRAMTRRRCGDTVLHLDAPYSPFGRFAFQFSKGDDVIDLRLRDGLLPDDFATLGRKAEAGMADDAETARWNSYKFDIGEALIAMSPEEVLERVELGASR
ncbi:MAG: hypothetical protein MI741_19735, partial [Rhodospirillales bacterium]|nr:hypothetical protein [Rhodospirillales bacterium]